MLIKNKNRIYAAPAVKGLMLPACKVGDRGFVSRSGIQDSKIQTFHPRSLVKIQYCGEPSWPRCSVPGLKPPGIEFVSVSGGLCHFIHLTSIRRFSLYVHIDGLKPPFILFLVISDFHLSMPTRFVVSGV